MMNEPIINPWFLYFTLQADQFITILTNLMIPIWIWIIMFIVINIISSYKKRYICMGVVFFIFDAALICFLPSTKTSTILLINSQITEKNIERVGQQTKDVYMQFKDDVLNAIEKSKEEKK